MASVGETLGAKYRLEGLLGEGGMGAVFVATNTWTGKRVAIKTLHAEHLVRPTALERFWQEARSATMVEHANIVDVLDFGVDEATHTPFIVQEHLQGRTLRQLLEERTKLAPKEALALLLPIVEGLVAAHRAGVVHRDLKPDNVFLVEGAGAVVPKLIDFGISKLMEDVEGRGPKTVTGFLLGTADYMSPEQAAGQHRRVDPQTDVWALGVLLYETLTGRRPFEAETDSLTLAKIIYEDPAPIRAHEPSLPADLAAIIEGTLVRDPAQRCPSAAALLDALRGCSVLRAESAVTASVPPAVVAREPARRGRLWPLAAVAVVTAGAAVALGVEWGHRAPARYALSPPVVVRSNAVPATAPVVAAPVVAAPVVAAPVLAMVAPTPAVTAPVAAPAVARRSRPAVRPVRNGRVNRTPSEGELAPDGDYR